MAIFFDKDNFTGIVETFDKDKSTGIISIKKYQDVSKILDANKEELNNNINNSFIGDMHKVASIPVIVIDMWRKELKELGKENYDPLSVHNRKFLISKINSSEWNKLRTKQGRI